jgi:chromosomal replication initiator protein
MLPADDFCPRLLARLSGGLGVRVHSPAAATRRTLVTRLSRQLDISIEGDAQALLAAQDGTTALALHGALKSLAARQKGNGAASIRRRDVARLLAEGLEVLDRRPATGRARQRSNGGETTLPGIASAAARYFAAPLSQLRSSSRRQGVVLARSAAIYLARVLTRRSLAEIGRFFGGRDHTTVLYNVRQAESRISGDPAFARAVADLHEKLRPREKEEK